MPVTSRLARLVVATATAGGCALAGAACSNSEPPQAKAAQKGEATAVAGPDGVQKITIEANDDFRFVPAKVHAKIGRIMLTLRTVGGTPHNLNFRTLDSVSVPTVARGESRTVDFSVSQPGEYNFLCTIHESLNQTGTLIVAR